MDRSESVQFKILGGMEVEAGGRPVNLAAPKLRVLLAVLLCRLGETMPVAELVDAVWQEHPPASAAENLRYYVHQLRKLIGADLLVRRNGGYSLAADPATVDARRFAELVGQAEAASADDAIRRAYRQGLALWHGRPFAGLPEEPSLVREAHRLEEQRLTAIESCADVELRLGLHAELVPELTTLVTEHPFRERLRGQLMLALYRAGRGPDALNVYRDLRATLVAELGIEPGRELNDLQGAILRDEAALDLQATAATRRSEEPDSTVPRSLPSATRHFTGRLSDLKKLDELVTGDVGPAVPLVTVVGPPGVGKTALVVRWAHDVAEQFPDGQLFVDLRGFHQDRPMEPAEAIAHLLVSLGVPAAGMPVGFADAVALYRSTLTGKRALVVLDNAYSADQVRDLLPGSASAAAVVTSRNRLPGLVAGYGARVLTLEPLPPDEAVELVGRVLDDGRVRDEPAAAEALVEACDRLPLALCMAAANLAEHAGRDIAAHLAQLRRDRFAALEVEGDSQFRLTATFDRSYDALDEPERRTFRLLGVFPGGDFTAATVAALVDRTEDEAAAHLHRLARAHLVGPHGGDRYALHDLLREYGNKKAADESDQTAERVFAYYVRRCDAAARALSPHLLRLDYPEGMPRDADLPTAPEAADWLRAELANLIAAGLDAAGRGHPAAWLIADLLRGYFWGRRHDEQWRVLAAAARKAARAADEPLAEAMAELSLGNYHYCRREFADATERYSRARDICRETGWTNGEAAVESALATVYTTAGDPKRAVERFEACLALVDEPLAATLNNLAGTLMNLGRLDDATDRCLAALAGFRAAGVLLGEALARINLATLLCMRGDHTEAREHATDSLQIAVEWDRLDMQALAHLALSLIDRKTGAPASAAKHAERAFDLSATLRDIRLECLAHNALAPAYRELGRTRAALTHDEAAIRLARQIPSRYTGVESTTSLAATYAVLGEPDRARQLATEALAEAETAGFRLLRDDALMVLASLA